MGQMLWHIGQFTDLRLDLVSLLAVLGEGSVTRTYQAAGISWWSCLPRILPAPQALLFHERPARLPTFPGTVAGAYSGNLRKEINWFAYLLHGDAPLPYVVEFIHVERTGEEGRRSFHFKSTGVLNLVTITSFCMSIALVGWSVSEEDAFGLLSVVSLSLLSSLIGLGTHWSLGKSFKEPKPNQDRTDVLPDSDVVIYYPNGAMRVISGEESLTRLYFQVESCDYLLGDTRYRGVAFAATLLLMCGVISLANSTPRVQVAFALAYVIVNGLYWAVSSLKPRNHWNVEYQCQRRPFRLRPHAADRSERAEKVRKAKEQKKRTWYIQAAFGLWKAFWTLHPARQREQDDENPADRTMTCALWAAIMLTGTSQWLNESTSIAPMNDAWKDWLKKADKQVRGKVRHDVRAVRVGDSIRTDMADQANEMVFPDVERWDFQGELRESLMKFKNKGVSQKPPETQNVLKQAIADDEEEVVKGEP